MGNRVDFPQKDVKPSTKIANRKRHEPIRWLVESSAKPIKQEGYPPNRGNRAGILAGKFEIIGQYEGVYSSEFDSASIKNQRISAESVGEIVGIKKA